MKWVSFLLEAKCTQSPPARGAWIEIHGNPVVNRITGSPPARGAWIEMLFVLGEASHHTASPPARGAWIEICGGLMNWAAPAVAPRTGGVD